MSSTSQSVGRTIKLFQTFSKERRALTSQEIAAFIEAPRSSSAALLKTLSDLGMVSIDRRTATYFPTARFAELGAWIADGSIYPQGLLDGLKRLAAVTGETVTLGAYNDLEIELVRVERSEQAISFSAERGQKLPLWGSGAGTAFLSRLDNSQIRTLYRRCADRKMISPKTQSLEDVLDAVEIARRNGFAIAEGAVFPDASAVSIATDIEANMRPLVVSVAGPTTRIKPRFAEIGRLVVAMLRERALETEAAV